MDAPADSPPKPPPAWAMSLLRNGAAAVLLGFIFSWFGVYETSALPFWVRTGYWVALMVLGFASAALCMPLVQRLLARAHAGVQIAVSSLLMSMPITAGLVLLHYLIVEPAPPSRWPLLYLYVVVVSLVLTTGQWLLTPRAAPAAAPSTGAQGPAGPAPSFLDRLPVRLRAAEIWAVSAEDHYLRVHTSAGQELILMRLADAIRELSALDGLQTHRSWWVARQGLADAGRENGKLVLKLKSGAEAPVSRTYAAAVKDRGWT